MKTWRLLLPLLAISTFLARTASAAAGWQPLGAVTAVQTQPHGLLLSAGRARVTITALNESVFQVRAAPDGSFSQEPSWAVLPEAAKPSGTVRFADSAESVEMGTSQVKIRIEKSTLRIVFLDPSDQIIVEDDARHPMAFAATEFRVWKSMPADEHYYGLGDKAGPIDHRNEAFTMWNTDAYFWQESTDPLYKSIPFFLALRHGRAYGIFLDNTYRSYFDFGKESRDSYSFGAEGGELNYYFFFGPHPKDVLAKYTALTGRTPLPPLWALGYQQSRWSYYPEARVREVARTLREHKIPADAIYLDIDYQDGNRPFTIDRQGFPNFEGMIQDLEKQGFKVVAITDLHIKKEPGYPPYDEGLSGSHFVRNPDGSVYVGKVWPGDSVFPEFTRAETRAWWGRLYADFVRKGIRGFWNDMNEPVVFGRADRTMPLDTLHRVDGHTEDHRAIHNVFGMQNARATYQGLLRLRPDLRPFVLTRAAFAGAQRYAASWTGDNTSSWNHLRLSIPTLLTLGLSGYPFVGVDVGGFVGSPPPDLLTRWIELGAFIPMFRNHTQKGTADQEPWVHSPEHEAIRRRYIELRYRLLPYLYTSFEETSRTGLPLMRPVLLEYPDQERFYENDSEFLFGHDLLVAPQVYEMTDSYTVDLPPGEWYDYWTGQLVKGLLRVKPALDELPLYVRAGAILPQQPLVQYTAEVPQGPLELRVYPGPDCRGSLYLDDGNTFAYQKGQFLRVRYTCQVSADSLRVKISPKEGSYSPWWKRIEISAFGVGRSPREVLLEGKAFPNWKYADAEKALRMTIPQLERGQEIIVNYRLEAR